MAPNEGTAGFAEQWPELADRLARSLSARGVSRCQQEDIIQETGLRLFAMWERVDQTRGAWPLALTIAKNLLWDDVNRRLKREVLGEVADRADSYDVERAGIARVELGRIRRILPELSASHRDILLTEVGVASEPDGNPGSIKMLRMRARRRLIALLDRASALGIGVVGAMRALSWRFQRNLRHDCAAEGYGAVATLVAAAIVGSLIVASDTPSAHADERPTTIELPNAKSDPLAHRRVTRDSTERERAHGTVVRGARPRPAITAPGNDHYDVGLGKGGPAEATLKVEIAPSNGTRSGVTPPSCETNASDDEMTVTCRAEATVDETTVKAKARVKARITTLRS